MRDSGVLYANIQNGQGHKHSGCGKEVSVRYISSK